MAIFAEAHLGARVAFELCIRNVDKPPLNYLAIAHRLAQFKSAETVILSRLPTFIDKAREFPGTTFLVGIDTLVRIAQAKYYGSALRATMRLRNSRTSIAASSCSVAA